MASDYRIGMRAELSPATDSWMRGDRYGDIVSVSTREDGDILRIHMDKSGKTLRVAERNIYRIFRA